MGWGGKGKGKGCSKGGAKAWTPQKQEEDEVEIEGGEDDDEEVELGADDDEEWLAFQSAVLAQLVASGTITAGKLGHELGGKKKPVAAALFALLEAGMVEKEDREGLPPKWSAKEGIDESELINAPIAERFRYDAEKKRAIGGGKSSRAQFETLKLLIRSNLKPQGVTAGYLGYNMDATKKVINAALYACEKDGTAWTVSDRESGTKLRWAGVVVECDEELPDPFRYSGPGGQEDGQPPFKKARTIPVGGGGGASVTGDPFEDMKLVCWAAVAAKGEKGVTSGALGFELACDRKAITASLYACQKDGKVNNVAEGGIKPKWVSLQDPPESAMNMSVPERFGYKGPGAPVAGGAVTKKPNQVIQVKQQTSMPNMEGLTPKQQAVLARKGGGKGVIPAAQPVQGGGAGPQGGGASNPVAFLNEWSQKSRKALVFSEAGQDGSGAFVCQCVMDGEEVASASARNKKQAKTNAAAAALSALGLA